MSYQLSVLLECDSRELAAKVAGQIARESRPVFEEDVAEDQRSIYAAIELVEFPDSVEVEHHRIWLSWFDEDRLQFEHLKKLLRVKGVEFVAAYEIPDYAEDEEDQWFWVPAGERFRRITPRKAESLLSKDVVKRLAN
jgi:hypothetical protein